MIRNRFIWAALAGLLGAPASGADLLEPSRIFANACAASCYNQHNQCRISRKGDSSCDAQLTSCLRSCNARR